MLDQTPPAQAPMLTQHLFLEQNVLHNINLIFQALGYFLQSAIDFN